MSQRWLDTDTFRTVIDATPLISIDLIVEDDLNRVLLGQRVNRPACHYWFVPGGRIQKNESLNAAFHRLSLEELGCAYERKNAQFMGVYEHLYTDSVFGEGHLEGNPSTHYVVLAYRLKANAQALALPVDQHSHYQWWLADDALANPQVHVNTQAYLKQ